MAGKTIAQYEKAITKKRRQSLFYYFAVFCLVVLSVCMFLIALSNADQDSEVIYTRDQYYGAVEYLSEKSIISGYTDGSFQPDNPIKYEEFIKMCTLVVSPEIEAAGNEDWSLPYYEEAVRRGFFSRLEVDEDTLDSDLQRIDMAYILGNMIQNVAVTQDLLNSFSYSDYDINSTKGISLVKAAVTGVVSGYSDGSFRPYDVVIRSDAVMAIYRLVSYNDALASTQ